MLQTHLAEYGAILICLGAEAITHLAFLLCRTISTFSVFFAFHSICQFFCFNSSYICFGRNCYVVQRRLVSFGCFDLSFVARANWWLKGWVVRRCAVSLENMWECTSPGLLPFKLVVVLHMLFRYARVLFADGLPIIAHFNHPVAVDAADRRF